MTSATLVHTSFPVTRPSLHREHIYRNHSPNPSIINPTNPAATETLYSAISYANKYHYEAYGVRYLYIDGISEAVGFVPEYFVQSMVWDPQLFSLPPAAFEGCATREIFIRTDFLPERPPPERRGLPTFRNSSDITRCCEFAFNKLVRDNSANSNFPSLTKWSATELDRREISSVYLFNSHLRDIRIPTPLRGFLGILTVGVHLNVYSKDYTGEYRIWVARRASGPEYSYPGMLDQIVAGGMDPEDRDHELLVPLRTLIREAREEVGLEIDERTRAVFVPGTEAGPGTEARPRRQIGKAVRISHITFFDKKDPRTGELDEHQLEPGVRIIYDLELTSEYYPQPNEPSIDSIMPMDVSQVKESLSREGEWKPNCGLVMLEFLVRHQLVNMNNDRHYDRIMEGLRPHIPFQFANCWRDWISG
ncbi:hypothetical protein FPSE_00053 [Fusarium pseudograminearum CS3096]|uniref:Nudix hydrolase domain-containing protein n=1 Tax=Fusarium pseudograminearum (strain CS3096) TaxID=1028729 RepID=K3VWW8_FUSPC|nr:hypothetical protein FPSE_00053 [Fusarium pseudograminearum CS3096]EKJ79773.1 hypothetical protein FPSE_00053 [Fusarium pseudograminearum CS3096]